MLSKTHIEEIMNKSLAEKWDYAKTFNALKEAGVDHYETKVATHEVIYYRGKKHISCHPGGEQHKLSVAKEFDINHLKKILKEHQTLKTSYDNFLKGIAEAGVSLYRVDMTRRTVSYLGVLPGQEYIEMVPQAKP